MRRLRWLCAVPLIPAFFVTIATAGPFDGLSIPAESSEFLAWGIGLSSFHPTVSGGNDGTNALGPPDSAFASLGDLTAEEIASGVTTAGSIVVSFREPIRDGHGWDFAVFENAGEFFESPFIFGELAYVDVSSNGVDFARFPSTSLNVEPGKGNSDTELNAGFGRDFAGINATNIDGLAGFHPQGWGTAFDLSDIANVDTVLAGLVDVESISFVRFVDIPGDGSRSDSGGRAILDAWPTGGGVGGFDLDAVGVRHIVPEPSTWGMVTALFLLLGLPSSTRRTKTSRGARP